MENDYILDQDLQRLYTEYGFVNMHMDITIYIYIYHILTTKKIKNKNIKKKLYILYVCISSP